MEPERIASLADPSVFPEEAATVEIIQTHLSVVCLVGDFAYKFKKAIELPFADFTDADRRRYFCEEEVRLNRRLCPDIYLEVVPLVRESRGSLRIGGLGDVVDHAVRMRRLAADRMMDVMLERNEVTPDQVKEIADRVCRFHEEAERSAGIDELGSPDHLHRFALANFDETAGCCGEVFDPGLHRALQGRTEADFDRILPVMRARVERGRVVDGHGDLHARNICLTEPVAIYDCIEFEPAFRCADVATEHAFLLMDLRFRGHPELAKVYHDAVLEESGDGEMESLLPCLARYRAMVRAKVSAITAGEAELEESEREAAAEMARGYLRFAAALAIEEGGPLWLVLGGLPGSGKTTVAEWLGERFGWPMISSDRVRKEMAGRDPSEELPAECYTEAFSDRVYAELTNRAEVATWSGSSVVILDANFRERSRRDRVQERADEAGAGATLAWLAIDEAVAEERIRKRIGEGGAESDADVAILRKLLETCEAPVDEERLESVSIEAAAEPDRVGDRLFAALLEDPGPT